MRAKRRLGLFVTARLVKWLLFPGLDLHTRCRYRFLPRHFTRGPIDTLDAGCGNGALAYAAHKLGSRVLGITNNPDEVRRNTDFFEGIEELRFQQLSLYDLPRLNQIFDQIICSETLEHIAGDDLIVSYFYQALRPDGVLHLCSPYAPHPVNKLGRTNGPEDGGHVRDGYTIETYSAMLTKAGFDIDKCEGLGSPLLVTLDSWVRGIRNRFGDLAALPVFLLLLPFAAFDRVNPREPVSLYVRAVKRPA